MKVSISCMGKFHSFHLACELDKRGYLERLLTPYYSRKPFLPFKFRNDLEEVDKKKVVTNLLPLIASKGFSKIPLLSRLSDWDYNYLKFFDLWARKRYGNPDILVVWSGAALETIRAAKACGIITVLERASTHIRTQNNLLEEEYAKCNINTKPIPHPVIKRELLEYNEADFISTPSCFSARSYQLNGIEPSRIIQVPFGVDLSLFFPKGKKDNIFRIMFCGAASLRKGVHYLLQAFSELNLKDSELWLVGAIHPHVNYFLKKYNSPNIKVLGKKPFTSLPFIYSQCDTFCLPSIEEGFGLVALQAMACGLPVICTTNTGAADVVRNGIDGYIVPIRNVEALKERITCLYEDKDKLNYMSKNVLNRVKEFTWSVYGERIVSKYKDILRSSKLKKQDASYTT